MNYPILQVAPGPITFVNHRLPHRTKALLGLLSLGILTLWMPGYWPTAAFLCGVFLLTTFEVVRKRATGEEKRTRPALFVTALLAVWPIWGFLQILLGITVYEHPTRVSVLGVLSYGCVVYLISGIPSGSVAKVRLSMLAFAFVVAVVAILQSATGGKVFWLFEPSSYSDSMMGPIIYRNHWAAFVETTLPIALFGSLRSRALTVWLYSAMAATLYASVIASASRSGVIICTAELLLVPLLVRHRYLIPLAAGRALLPVIGTLGLFTIIVGPELVIERFTSASDITEGRADWDRTSLAMIGKYKWCGAGLGNWPTLYPQYSTSDLGTYVNQAHNDWLQWAVEGGAYLGIIFAIASVSYHSAQCFPWVTGVVAVFCQSLVDYPFSRPALAAWSWTILGLSLASNNTH